MRFFALPLAALVFLGGSFTLPEATPPAYACGGASLLPREVGPEKLKVFTTPSWIANEGGLENFGGQTIARSDLLLVVRDRQLVNRRLAIIVDAEGQLFAGRVDDKGATILRKITVEAGKITYDSLNGVHFRSGSRGCNPVTPDENAW